MARRYVIVGGGLAGASAIEGIRSVDREGAITMLTRDNHAPYHRPPLSKGLWFGKTKPDELPVHPDEFYREQGVDLVRRREVVEIEPERHVVHDDRGTEYPYDALLLATGGRPSRLDVPGADLDGVHYYRDLDDYLFFESRRGQVEHALVIGGGFIGLEMSAALTHAGAAVTLVYTTDYPLARLLPRDLGMFVAEYYREKGVETVSNDIVTAIEPQGGHLLVRTASGGTVTTQLVLAGVGIDPATDLGEAIGLEIDDGILVDEYCRTSDPRIYAAGDVAEYPDTPLRMVRRVEHWDHALRHGRCAGVNMAGGAEAYPGLPLFYSDFFDLGWEGVGELSTNLEIETLWREPFREGVVFYMDEGVTRGVLLWNVWEKVEAARALIREARPLAMEERLARLGV